MGIDCKKGPNKTIWYTDECETQDMAKYELDQHLKYAHAPPEPPVQAGSSDQEIEPLKLYDEHGNHEFKYGKKKSEYQCCECDDQELKPIDTFKNHLFNKHMIEVHMGRNNPVKGPYIKRILSKDEQLSGKRKFKCECKRAFCYNKDLKAHKEKKRCPLGSLNLQDVPLVSQSNNDFSAARAHTPSSSGTSISESASSPASPLALDSNLDDLLFKRVSVICIPTSKNSDITSPTLSGNIQTQQAVKLYIRTLGNLLFAIPQELDYYHNTQSQNQHPSDLVANSHVHDPLLQGPINDESQHVQSTPQYSGSSSADVSFASIHPSGNSGIHNSPAATISGNIPTQHEVLSIKTFGNLLFAIPGN